MASALCSTIFSIFYDYKILSNSLQNIVIFPFWNFIREFDSMEFQQFPTRLFYILFIYYVFCSPVRGN